MIRFILTLILIGICLPIERGLYGQSTVVNWTSLDSLNPTGFLFKDGSGVPLSSGAATINQDGDLVELGFFSAGTQANNFQGNWVPLTLTTTIGDSSDLAGAGAGLVAFNTFFSLGQTVKIYTQDLDTGYYTSSSSVPITASLPAINQVLAIRFFDSLEGSGHYNTVSADTWLWKAPSITPAIVNIDLAASTLEWENPSNPFKTTIAVPEPSVTQLCFFGTVFAFGGYGLRFFKREIKKSRRNLT